MDKKSAIATAGGLVASFVAGVAAVSFNWGMGTPSTPASSVSPTAPTQAKPIIKHRTITIHKRDPASTPAPRTVVLPAPSTSSSPSVALTGGSHTAGGEDDGEHEGGSDD